MEERGERKRGKEGERESTISLINHSQAEALRKHLALAH